jgi:hypothetical protein
MYDNRLARWLDDPLDKELRARKLPSGLEIALKVEDRAIVLPRSAPVAPSGPVTTPISARASPHNSTAKSPQAAPALTPQVMLYSNGDLTRFTLTLSRTGTNRSAALTGTSAGKFEVGAIVEKPP